MALQTREIEVNMSPREGAVSNLEKRKSTILREAQENLALSNSPIYAPNLEERLKGIEPKGRIISHSFLLNNLYNTTNILLNKIKINSSDNEEMKEVKAKELELLSACVEAITPVMKDFASQEYPNSTLNFIQPSEGKAGSVHINMQGDPQKVKLDRNSKKGLYNVIDKVTKLTSYMELNSPTFQGHIVSAIKKYNADLAQMYEGVEVRQAARSNNDIINDLKRSVEMLIRDDSLGGPVIDRERAEHDLAKKLSNHGLDLIRIPVEENINPQEEVLNQAKTCVLRATWDGFIERPQSTDMLSPALQAVLHKGKEKVDPRLYKFEESPIWSICEKSEEFRKFKFDIAKGLAREGFPPEAIKDLSYADIAYIINVEHLPTSRAEEKFQRKNIARTDGVRIKSGREAFVKKYVQEHEKDIRTLLVINKTPLETVNSVISDMKKGKSPLFDGHHNYSINNPSYYEKVTGKDFMSMNRDVVFIDKGVHQVVHMLENNVNAVGRVVMHDAKSSFRTVFKDKESGKKFYYAIRIKEGIEGLTSFNCHAIFNRDFLSGLTFEEPQEEKKHNDAQKTDHEIEDNINRIRSKSSQLQDRKEQNNEPDIKPRENRDRPIGRNDYRGTKGLYLKKNKITSRR